MSWEEPDGSCEDCGLDLDQDPRGDHEDWHRYCWECWNGGDDEDDYRREERLPPGTVNQTALGAVIDLRRDLEDLCRRVENLERIAVDLAKLAKLERDRRRAA
jgi:hypothetical protein